MSDAIHVMRAELRKLAAQLPIRLVAVAVVLGPVAFAAALRVTGATPADTLFGIWVHSSGFAVALVTLSFAGAWGFPLIAAVLAGDVFASEDRHGTWKTVLTRACSRGDVFAGKCLAVGFVASGLLLVAALVSLAAGVGFVGAQSLVGLSGQELGAGHALWVTLASWLLNVPPLLGFTALAVLCSVLARNGILGVVVPVLAALVMQLLALVGRGVWVHQLLLLAAFDGWHGLLAAPAFGAQLLLAVAVSLVWTALCLGVAWRSLRGRDIAGPPAGTRAGWRRAAVGAAVVLALVAVVGAAANLGRPVVTPRELAADLRPAFNRLTLLQQRLLGRTVVPGARIDDTAVCARRGSARNGPGNDWTCTINVLIPQAGTSTPNFEPVDYDLTVKSNGCWSAEGPPSFVGNQTFRTSSGATATNPLFRLEGCFDPL